MSTRFNISSDIIFSCLGTTRENTLDVSDYRKIELEYPLAFAREGLINGMTLFHTVSSIGADAESKSSYLSLKGELEKELRKLTYPSLNIYQPSFLTGRRKENRLSDKIISIIMRLINPVMQGSLKKY